MNQQFESEDKGQKILITLRPPRFEIYNPNLVDTK